MRMITLLALALFAGVVIGMLVSSIFPGRCECHPSVLSLARLSSPPGSQTSIAVLAPAFNPLRPAVTYAHAPVFARFHRWKGAWSPNFVADWLGVQTSIAFDCMGDYSYNQFVPSRRLPCDAHAAAAANLAAGAAPPPIYGEMPLVDDEYPEYVDMLSAIVHAAERRASEPAFVIVELGARYGTWGVRALAAWRALGVPGEALFVGVDSLPKYAQWMREHAEKNGVSDSVVVLEGMAAQAANCPAAATCYSLHDVVRAAGNASHIDFLDLDIQGAESDFFSGADTAALMNRVVAAVHVGTHAADTHKNLRGLFESWGWHMTMDYGGIYHARMLECDSKVAQALQTDVSCLTESPWGPIYVRDGLLGFVNPAFAAGAATLDGP